MDKTVTELAQDLGPRAIERLNDIMETAVEDRDVIKAATELLDRGYGKAAQAVISLPANRRQAAILAAMTDEQLVAVIEKKALPRIGAPQPLTTIEAGPVATAKPNRIKNSHGPLEPEDAIDPLLA